MADTKISAMTAITGANVDRESDQLTIVDTSVPDNKKITPLEMFEALAYEDAGANLMMYYNFY